jgi:tetratricopeptide (TPR) repeat protein
VFPNHLWTVPPFRERGDGAVRLGFGGSLGHLEDLQWIAPTVRDALARHPSAVMCVMGAPEFQQFFRSLPPEQFQYTPGGSLEDYLRFVASLDVGLCPNLSTDFNACRSDIKWAEYSAHGVATVCSDIPPYADVRHGETGLRFADLPGLAACLDQVLTDAPLRRGLARRAWELVASQRVERAHASERLTAWGLTVPDEGVPWPERATLERRRGGVRTFDGSNSIHLAFGPLEEKLYQGLTRARDRVDAVEAFTAAKRLGPDFYLPWLYLGNAESDARRAEELLRRACALAPMAYAPSFLRGLRLRQLGREDEAKAELERCRTLAPSVGAAQGALGELALANGDVDGAIACFEDAFAHNPWRPIAGLQAASAQLDRGRPARTVELVEACLQHDVPQGPEALLLGRAYFALGRFQDARRQLEQVLASTTEPVPVLALLAKAHLALGNQRMADVLLGELKRLVGDGPKR